MTWVKLDDASAYPERVYMGVPTASPYRLFGAGAVPRMGEPGDCVNSPRLCPIPV